MPVKQISGIYQTLMLDPRNGSNVDKPHQYGTGHVTLSRKQNRWEMDDGI